MDLALTPELVEIQERSRRFLDEHLLPVELQCELEGGLPAEVLARIAQGVIAARLHAVNMPRAWGGQGYTWLEQVISQEQLGRSTNALWDVVWRPANVLRHCNDEQRERYLLPEIEGRRRYAYAVTEPGAGSDASRLQTRAVRTPGGWRIDGEKWFVTAADVADYLIVVADAEGHGPTAFLIDQGTPGLRETRRPRYMHTFVYEHPEYVLEGCEVADAQVLGGLGKGHELSREWFIEERLMIAARCLGGAQRALEVALEYACEREQFGQRIVDFQGVSFPLASSAVELAAARAFVYQVAWEASRGLDPKALHAKASAIKLHASEMAGRVADRALQVLGGRGYMRENPVERLYRDLRVDRIWEGTSEIQRVVVANELVKRGPATVTGWPLP
jgi:acyl-CoA dehydrogenase